MHINEVLTAIRNGTLDANLDLIRNATVERPKARAPKAYEFRPGQRVFFNNNTRPHYLRGAEAVVVKVNQVKIVVDLVVPMGKFNKNVTVPTSLIAIPKAPVA